ncbi:MAG: ABC transporter, ATPase subunit [Candidatus Roizmanbacteria bacterium GW2011_GWC2_37_13]|uniref:ABC transporter, ATPase subunit n=1 Tax=Candidatus Roizmanbacteria bacterium GW2011_GWC2_37_13 TaxID=1618486 RepID=A0A0G0JAH5_9BACT|nr:MAG: ABC transporter, ATPase subunit [Candidatus Roizmanbacteria bacterium GW2011_GWC1_37_12]KKQ25236.1 MAG: ABC transporter, ATPase subunit [Candidatus Roizmanbacteria bacterium GW2011_GWC2_37_13]
MDILTVTNLTKKFGKFTAVNNISFSLREGEILGLLGPNGAGKTTTIDILLGVTKPTSGKITIFNLPFEENRVQILKQMNFSAAYINLPWSLKVWENLYTFARLYEVDGFKEKVQKLMKEFKLYNLKDKPTDSLSSGQLTRLYLCKAFINNPRLLLLDEPTAFLDPDVADLMRKYILKEVKTKKTSILFTSHNMAEVTEICDRVIFLNRGKIIAKDTPINLAMRIKFCRVRLFFDEKKKNAEELLRNYKYIFSLEGKEIVVETEEEKVGQLLGRLSLAKLKYSQITIEKPTLEDFFIKIAREKI